MPNGVRQTTTGVVQTTSGVAQTVLAAVKSIMDDFNDGSLSEWDKVDSSWGTSGTHAYEGDFGVRANNTSGSLAVMIATQGSLDADFAPGDVMHMAYSEVGGGDTGRVYFGKQDTTDAANGYNLGLRILGGGGGVGLRRLDGTTLFDEGDVLGLPSGSGVWGHVYIYWRPDDIKNDPDNTSSPNSDGEADGDFYVEIQDDNHVPKFSAYMNADDTTYTDGGVGLRVNDNNDFAYDILEKGSPSAFDNFTPSDHIPGTNEIAHFETGDLRGWEGNVAANYEIVGSATVTAKEGSYCLMLPNSAGFRTDGSASDGSMSDQPKTLPNYLADGEKGEVYVRTEQHSNETYVGCCLADISNYVRIELDWGDRLRIMHEVSGSLNTLSSDTGFSGAADEWFRVVMDRTTSSSLTVIVEDSTGTEVSNQTVDPDSSLDNNDGMMIGGNAGPNFYYDGWGLV